MATLARLLITAGGNPAATLLGVGTASLLASDVGYGLEQLGGSYTVGNPYDFGWALFYTAWGAAALHPSMADLTVPVPGPSGEMSIRRIALLMAVSLVAPGALLADSLTGERPARADDRYVLRRPVPARPGAAGRGGGTTPAGGRAGAHSALGR